MWHRLIMVVSEIARSHRPVNSAAVIKIRDAFAVELASYPCWRIKQTKFTNCCSSTRLRTMYSCATPAWVLAKVHLHELMNSVVLPEAR